MTSSPLDRKQARLRTLTYWLVFLTFDLIVFGAFTRLTDSGLGCPDWPGCYGNLSPFGARHEIGAAQSLMPTGPVTHIKAWIEMLHRYFAMVVGFLIIVRLVWGIQLQKTTQTSTLLPWLTLVWVCVQGAFGALTVTMKLFPAIVTLHLLGAFVLLTMLQVQATQQDLRIQRTHTVPLSAKAWVWLLVALATVWLQAGLGGWVSTNYAVLACPEFPTCQAGQWWPATVEASHWREGFVLWRDLGKTTTGTTDIISFEALTAIHLTHRAFALVVIAAFAGLIWQLRHVEPLRGLKRWLMVILTLQIITGISNVVLGWPLLAAVLHTAGAAGMIVVLTRIATRAKQRK